MMGPDTLEMINNKIQDIRTILLVSEITDALRSMYETKIKTLEIEIMVNRDYQPLL